MTKMKESEMSTIPARRRALPAAPVLIRVPALDATGSGIFPTPRRRRLRREIRLAACWMLALIPPMVACATLGGARSNVLLALLSPASPPSPTDSGTAPDRVIVLSLEPVLAPPAAEAESCPVFLSGQILPLDAAEEATHGGH